MGTESSPTCSESTTNRKRLLFLLLIVVSVMTVRGGHIDSHGLWEDEAVRYYRALGNDGPLIAEEQMSDMPVVVREDWHRVQSLAATSQSLKYHSNSMPAHSYLINLTTKLVGPRKFTVLKSWNVLLSLLTAMIVWVWANRSLGLPGAVVAVSGYVLSTWDMAVTLQLKEYALAATCVTGSSWLLWEIVRNGWRRGVAVGYGVFVGLGLVTHMHVWMMVALQGLYVVAASRFRGQEWHRLARTVLVSTLPLTAWLIFAGRQQLAILRKSDQSFGDPYGGFVAALERLWPLVETLIAPIGDGLAPVGISIVVLTLATVGFFAARASAGRLAGTIFFGAITCSWLFHIATHDGHALWPRYFVITIPCLWIAVAGGLSWLLEKIPDSRTRRLSWFAAWFIVVAQGVFQVSYFAGQSPPLDMYADWRENVKALNERIMDGDFIVHSPGGGAFTAFSLYWAGPNQNMAWDGQSLLPGDALSNAAGDSAIWFILTWGRQNLAEIVKDQMLAAGYSLIHEIAIQGGTALCWKPAQANNRSLGGHPETEGTTP